VIRRLYVHNFRCLENFELKLEGMPSVLLIGKNGSGKTAVGLALEVLQKIGRGATQASELVKQKDRSRGRSEVPIRFEIEAAIDSWVIRYSVAFQFPRGSGAVRVFHEELAVDGAVMLARGADGSGEADPKIDSQLVALPIIAREPSHPLHVFRRCLARMLILRPVPSLISGDSTGTIYGPNPQVTDFGAWFSGRVSFDSGGYTRMADFLKQVMPDFTSLQNPEVGKDSRSLVAQFATDQGMLTVPFADLSDGEKCFMIGAVVLSGNDGFPPWCFWDEPDNYLALGEVQQFVVALRRAFEIGGGQLIATSHNPEAISCFSDENTLVLQRRNHMEPTVVRRLSELEVDGDLVGAIVRGDLE